MASRKIEDLNQSMQDKYKKFKEEMDKEEIDFIVTCTYRTQEEQDELYKQGRTTPGKIVTWIKHSRHNAYPAEAFDIAIMKNGKISWDDKDYLRAAQIGRDVGLFPGADFPHNKDYPHFQDTK